MYFQNGENYVWNAAPKTFQMVTIPTARRDTFLVLISVLLIPSSDIIGKVMWKRAQCKMTQAPEM